MELTPDAIELVRIGPVVLTATLVFTYAVMTLLVLGSWAITRRLDADLHPARGQHLLESIVDAIDAQAHEIAGDDADRYVPFVGTLFLFIAVSNTLAVVPGFHAPTGSLSTTAALALCVFVAVPVFGIRREGLRAYLRGYLEPSPILLPFHVLSELSRTVSLAIRLFGTVMSGAMIAGVLLIVAPLFLPVVMQAFELLIGFIQAYIFSVLAMVYIASAGAAHEQLRHERQEVGRA